MCNICKKPTEMYYDGPLIHHDDENQPYAKPFLTKGLYTCRDGCKGSFIFSKPEYLNLETRLED